MLLLTYCLSTSFFPHILRNLLILFCMSHTFLCASLFSFFYLIIPKFHCYFIGLIIILLTAFVVFEQCLEIGLLYSLCSNIPQYWSITITFIIAGTWIVYSVEWLCFGLNVGENVVRMPTGTRFFHFWELSWQIWDALISFFCRSRGPSLAEYSPSNAELKNARAIPLLPYMPSWRAQVQM